MEQYTYLVACPFLSIAATAGAFVAAGWAVPFRTKAGAAEAARWETFKQFLQHMPAREAEKHKPQFAPWLPYAIALGVEKEFVKKFAAANAPQPKWWGQPEEKALDLSPDQSYVWVSADEIKTRSQPKPAETTSKSVIRRLGSARGETGLLKDIQANLISFLEAGYAAFSKAPNLSEAKDSKGSQDL